jgi:hypothetical protein
MKFLQRCWTNIPDQVLSTALLFGMGFVFYRGFLSVWNDPPATKTCLVVIVIGVILGVFVSLPERRSKEDVKKDL